MFLKKIILIVFLITVVAVPPVVLADDFGLFEAAKNTSLIKSSGGSDDFFVLVGKVVGAGLSMIGIIFFVLILYGGGRWMTAMGRSEEVEKAKSIMESAVIGLVIVLSAYAITSFVIGSLTGEEETINENNVFDCEQATTLEDCGLIAEESNCHWENNTCVPN